MDDEQFRMLLDLWMVSDPWPLSDDANVTLTRMLDAESERRGYDNYVVAYHEFRVSEETTP